MLSVVDAKARKVVREVGPFTSYVCPFTINGRASQVFANIDGLVGFEVGDLQTGLVLDRVVIEGYQMELAEKFECPSHGIGLTPMSASCGLRTASTIAFMSSTRPPTRPWHRRRSRFARSRAG